MRNIRFLLVLATVVLVLSACSPAQVTPTPVIPTFAPINFSTPYPTATPEPATTPTLSTQDAAIEAAWAIQKPKIDTAVTSVFNNNVTSPWLSPIFDDANLVIPDSPAAHCQAMKIWDNFIPVPGSLSDCKAGQDPIKDYFGITTAPLQTSKNDNFILKIFPYMPIPYCDGKTTCVLLPGPGGAYWGMSIGNYKVVTICGKPTGTPMNGSLDQLFPYLKDPTSMILKGSDGYIEIIANRGAWFSFGWTSGKGWSESFQFCPSF